MSINHLFSSSNYLIQKYIDLDKLNNSVFDIRVVTQKKTSDKWQCTGIEVRKADRGNLLTNISRNGRPITLTECLNSTIKSSLKRKTINSQILKLSLLFCSLMDKNNENYFEFGLDLALDTNKKLWFIEANVLPAFQGFKKINYENYLSILYNPLKYAAFKTGFNPLSETKR